MTTDHVTEIAVRKQDISPSLLSADQLKFISNTEFVPKSMRGNMPAILACVATGRALGLPDMTALRSINIIDGKAAFAAELMVARVRDRGHSITGEVSGTEAVVHGKRIDNGDEMTSTFTIDMAQRAGLLGKSNWKNYPESMLWARAVSQLCRMLFADCFAGQTYTPDEAEDTTVDELMDEPPAAEAAADQDDDEPLEGEIVEDGDDAESLTARLLELTGGGDNILQAVQANAARHADDPAKHVVWLRSQVRRAESARTAA